MARDYFQDIMPPSGDERSRAPSQANAEETRIPIHAGSQETPSSARSIRNISIPNREGRRPMSDMRDTREVPTVGRGQPRPPRQFSRRWIWGLAGLCLLVLAALLLLALRSTLITVTPRSHTVVFDQSAQFSAFPVATAASGTLAYSVQVTDLEDSEVVPSQGTVHAEDKASGTITVYNNYSAATIRLIKNTRFQAPDGLIFRAPADVVIPGKTGGTAGQVSVTVIADQPGEQYNVAPISRFTLPGLKSASAEYAQVYAASTAAMSGGFSGDRPGVDPAALAAAVSTVRDRLDQKAHDAAHAATAATTVFPDLMAITYQDLPDTSEAGGGVRIHESAHVQIPVFDSSLLAQAVASAVSADAGNSSLHIVPGANFGAHATSTVTVLGTDPLQFTLVGTAQLVWDVDTGALAAALAGRDQGAFQTIVKGFPGIQEARARIEPFWSSTFPKDPTAIQVEVVAPTAQ